MKIIQILITSNDPKWQSSLLGLGDDGVVYVEDAGKWVNIIKPEVKDE